MSELLAEIVDWLGAAVFLVTLCGSRLTELATTSIFDTDNSSATLRFTPLGYVNITFKNKGIWPKAVLRFLPYFLSQQIAIFGWYLKPVVIHIANSSHNVSNTDATFLFSVGGHIRTEGIRQCLLHVATTVPQSLPISGGKVSYRDVRQCLVGFLKAILAPLLVPPPALAYLKENILHPRLDQYTPGSTGVAHTRLQAAKVSDETWIQTQFYFHSISDLLDLSNHSIQWVPKSAYKTRQHALALIHCRTSSIFLELPFPESPIEEVQAILAHRPPFRSGAVVLVVCDAASSRMWHTSAAALGTGSLAWPHSVGRWTGAVGSFHSAFTYTVFDSAYFHRLVSAIESTLHYGQLHLVILDGIANELYHSNQDKAHSLLHLLSQLNQLVILDRTPAQAWVESLPIQVIHGVQQSPQLQDTVFLGYKATKWGDSKAWLKHIFSDKNRELGRLDQLCVALFGSGEEFPDIPEMECVYCFPHTKEGWEESVQQVENVQVVIVLDVMSDPHHLCGLLQALLPVDERQVVFRWDGNLGGPCLRAAILGGDQKFGCCFANPEAMQCSECLKRSI